MTEDAGPTRTRDAAQRPALVPEDANVTARALEASPARATEHATVVAARAREARVPAAERRAAGVVHTPMELARWAARRVHARLQQAFALPRGLADARALVLDPAVGTGVWLAAVLDITRPHATYAERPRRMWGFDVDGASLAITHALLAHEAEAQRVQLALRCENTLAVADPWPEGHDGVRVILGNPPWAARSRSRGTPLSDAWLAEFRRDAEGNDLGERRSGVLSDDYVRFFRWALEQARTAPAGAILCFATNSSFLDGPVHRGMRAALLAAFDTLEVLDLGGNALLARGEGRDDNLFGVRVGAALTLATRLSGSHARRASLSLGRLEGAREAKLGKLREDAAQLATHGIQPQAPWYWFRAARPAASQGFSLAEAFPFHREGLQTNRDELCTAPTREALLERLTRIASGELALPRARHFDPDVARARLAEALARDPEACWVPLAYRPFEVRAACVVAPLCHRPRPALLEAVARSSFSLLSVRKDRGAAAFALFGAARHAADACYLSTRSSCRTRAFPTHTPDGAPNLSPEVQAALARVVGDVTVEAAMAYALGVLASERFRAQQGEAFKLDYPRVPWPPSAEAFWAFVRVGEALLEALCPQASERDRLGEVRPRAPDAPFDPRELTYGPEAGVLSVRGVPVVSGVRADVWETSVGHHALRRSIAGRASPCTPRELAHLLARATHFRRALDQADASFHTYFG